MNKENKILIIAPYQFGELSDCYYWAKYATEQGYSVTYIGYRYSHRQMKERECPGVKVIGVHHFNKRIVLGLFFFIRIIWEILIHRHHNIVVCKFPYAEMLAKLFSKRNVILDIRTLSVSADQATREQADRNTRNVALQFTACSVISEGVKDKLGINATILPLGAECISNTEKDFSVLRLFYIGTFDNRNLPVFLKGLAMFNKRYELPVTFDIVGGGSKEEENAIKDIISTEKLDNVRLHGYLTHDEAKKYFDNCNVGVCYVPMVEYYEHQPPTKLYEYLLSGMVCIATGTKSNRAVMSDKFGVLIEDDAESVCMGLHELYNQRDNYKSDVIVSSAMQYHWKNIVKDVFIKMLEE